jgi:hypothetical protein
VGVCQSEVALIEIKGSLVKGDPGLEKMSLIFSGSQSGFEVLELLQTLISLGRNPTSPMQKTSQIKAAQNNKDNYNQGDRFLLVHYHSSLFIK